ncbi:MAG: hypothetical protein DPW16_22095 [Chloroflexi bacterium]|nr:hypothetical protein [Chloroflexota bacterium]
MPMCINCGSDKVERQGDDFTCHKCQFQWDVAFEQANKVYLRAQGRLPATSVLETPSNAEQGVLMPSLSQAGNASLTSTVAVATADPHAGDGPSPWAAVMSPATPPSGRVGSDAAATGVQVEPSESIGGDAGPAGVAEAPSAAPLPKAAQSPSTAKSKKG